MRLTVVIPSRDQCSKDNITVRTLERQTWRDFKTVWVADTARKGANWARNWGFKVVSTELVLFSDDDIDWHPDALRIMVECLDQNPAAAYSYCGYVLRHNGSDRIISDRAFDPRILKCMNYISTMSVVRTVQHPGFDEAIPRFQDWDVWLTMLKQGYVGVYCGRVLFTTEARPGITMGNTVTPLMADKIIKEKHTWMRSQ